MSDKEVISFSIPSLSEQRLVLLEQGIDEGIKTLKSNLSAKRFPKSKRVDYDSLDEKPFLTQEQGWSAPPGALVDAWFEQFKSSFPQYGSDEKIANLLGIRTKGASRQIRAFRSGEKDIPYGIWRRFLVITGRVSQEIYPVLGIFDIDERF
jgi:hypothetical protein